MRLRQRIAGPASAREGAADATAYLVGVRVGESRRHGPDDTAQWSARYRTGPNPGADYACCVECLQVAVIQAVTIGPTSRAAFVRPGLSWRSRQLPTVGICRVARILTC